MRTYKITIMSLLAVALLFGCESKESKSTYIKTDRGLVSYGYGYCTLGMLTNNDGVNMLDENSNPITCQGYINLTNSQKDSWSNSNENL